MKKKLLEKEFLVTRAGFLKGLAAAFGARLFAAPPGWTPPGKANLVFGVVSDTHLRTTADGKYSKKYWSDKWFVAALRCFRDNNVDAVLHLGDMAHTGQVAEMEFHATAWRKVFPKDLAPDGHKVERLFVAGNHDLDGTTYGIGKLVKDLYPDPDQNNPVNPVDPVKEKTVRVTIPPADGNPKCRVFAYDVAVSAEKSSKPSKPVKCVFATGCNVNAAHAPHGGVTTVEFNKDELPSGATLTFTVTPRSCLGTSGMPLTVEIVV